MRALFRHCKLLIPDGFGGPGEVRTLDLMTASHARSQLRHRPTWKTDNPLFLTRARGAVNNLMAIGCATWKLGAVNFLFLCYIAERI